MKRFLVFFLIIILMGVFSVDILGRSMKDIQARMVGQLNYRINVVKGVVGSENINKTYNCYIAGETMIYPNIPTFSRDPKLQPGDEVTIEFINGCRETPAILAPEDIRERPDTTEIVLEGWNLLTATYDVKYKYMRTEESTPYSFRINPDGTRLYLVGATSGTVFQYTFGTAWDITTVFYSGLSFGVFGECPFPYGMSFSSNGDKIYVLDGIADTIYQYNLGMAWNISTAVYSGSNFAVGGQCPNPFDIYINSDGNKLYVVGYVNDTVYQYTLGTVWDISTAVYNGKFFYTGGEDDWPFDLSFKSDGTQMFIAGSGNDKVYHYNITTAWDVSTAVYDAVFFSLAGEGITNPRCLFLKPDGLKMYVLAYNDYRIYQYSLGSK